MRTANTKAIISNYAVALLLANAMYCPGHAVAARRAPATKAVLAVVSAFCGWDLDGARLGSRNPHYDDVAKVILATSEWPEEPIDLVSDARVVSAAPHGNRFDVEVKYTSLGELQGGLERDGLTIKRRNETVHLTAVLVSKQWKIDLASFSPHVSVDAMRKHVEQVLHDDEAAGDTHRKALLTRLIGELSALQPGVPSS